MKNVWIKLAVAAACSMLSVSAWATDEPGDSAASSNQTSRTWSSKHLTATGRDAERSVRASRLNGAVIEDSSGNRIGQIQDVILNPAAGRIEFAIVSLNAGQGAASSPSGSSSGSSSQNLRGNQATTETGTSSRYSASTSSNGKMIPVPWSLLKPISRSESFNAAQPSFTLKTDVEKLNQAPTLERGSWSEIDRAEWRDRVHSYYGVSADSGTGAAESPSGSQKGHEAEKLIENQNP